MIDKHRVTQAISTKPAAEHTACGTVTRHE